MRKWRILKPFQVDLCRRHKSTWKRFGHLPACGGTPMLPVTITGPAWIVSSPSSICSVQPEGARHCLPRPERAKQECLSQEKQVIVKIKWSLEIRRRVLLTITHLVAPCSQIHRVVAHRARSRYKITNPSPSAGTHNRGPARVIEARSPLPRTTLNSPPCESSRCLE